ncbi:MAG: hypothetical protein HYZ74_04765 [Elusimicrobia bacterium]|nr:hypothetical protein [Elusimicrobiota bacterium]
MRWRFSIIILRLAGSVCTSEIRSPFSACSSVPATKSRPSCPGTARGETPVSVFR